MCACSGIIEKESSEREGRALIVGQICRPCKDFWLLL